MYCNHTNNFYSLSVHGPDVDFVAGGTTKVEALTDLLKQVESAIDALDIIRDEIVTELDTSLKSMSVNKRENVESNQF